MMEGGFVDIVVEEGLKKYDIEEIIKIIEKEGGVVKRREGGKEEKGGDIVEDEKNEMNKEEMDMINI